MNRFFRMFTPIAAGIAVLFLVGFVFLNTALASGTVVNCSNDSAFASALAGGGTVAFDCGGQGQTATIILSSTKTITANTIIDGNGKITLSGGHGYRLFVVNNGVTLTLRNLTLIDGYNPNSAGGAAVSNNGHLILENVTVHSMIDSAFNGGGIATYGALDISNSTFYNNKATNGGAIFASGAGAVVTINNGTFQYNKATGVTQNTNGFGGGIYAANGAQVTIQAGTFYSNTASDGGAIYMGDLASALNLQSSALRENSATYKGGGILNAGTTTVADTTLDGNSTPDISLGGGIFNYGNLTLTQATLSNNKSYAGGAIHNFLGTANLTDVTLSGNTAIAYGGGISNYNATMNLTNVTLHGNTTGILNQNSATTHLNLKNVILSKSTNGDNCAFNKAPDTSDHNLSTDATCNFGIGRDNAKVKLGALETNGGNTLTHRLLPGSAAIDAGVFVLSILTDQRSVTRPRGSAFDVGAVEYVPCTGAPTTPALLSPAQNAQVNTQTVVLDWVGPDCAKTFNVTVHQGSKTGALVYSHSNIKRTQITTPALAKNKTYVWQITACNSTGCAASSWGKFTVQ